MRLGTEGDHYYILSRFLLSRSLTVTKIPHEAAIKIALELKKLLVDSNLLAPTQRQVELHLFAIMARRGFGHAHVARYTMMRDFHIARPPLIVCLCGTMCVGKSALAAALAARFNVSNVLQLDVVCELLRVAKHAPLDPKPLWCRPEVLLAMESASQQTSKTAAEENVTRVILESYLDECRVVLRGIDGELRKAVSDGKTVVMEGAMPRCASFLFFVFVSGHPHSRDAPTLTQGYTWTTQRWRRGCVNYRARRNRKRKR